MARGIAARNSAAAARRRRALAMKYPPSGTLRASGVKAIKNSRSADEPVGRRPPATGRRRCRSRAAGEVGLAHRKLQGLPHQRLGRPQDRQAARTRSLTGCRHEVVGHGVGRHRDPREPVPREVVGAGIEVDPVVEHVGGLHQSRHLLGQPRTGRAAHVGPHDREQRLPAIDQGALQGAGSRASHPATPVRRSKPRGTRSGRGACGAAIGLLRLRLAAASTAGDEFPARPSCR